MCLEKPGTRVSLRDRVSNRAKSYLRFQDEIKIRFETTLYGVNENHLACFENLSAVSHIFFSRLFFSIEIVVFIVSLLNPSFLKCLINILEIESCRYYLLVVKNSFLNKK